MRRVLILGGTAWLGREIARLAAAGGADVTCLARGESGAAADGVRLVRADRRDTGAYDGLDGEWDEVVEVSRDPELAGSALEALADRAAHWTLVSTISVYARDDEPDADESAELVEPRDLTRYPDAKVTIERASQSLLEGRLLTVRAGLIAGPGDPTDRFGYWPARLHRGGQVLVPTMGDRFVQAIDVADLAAWIVQAGADRRTGIVNGVGPVHPMAEFFRIASEVTRFEGELVAADDETLLSHDVRHWAGPRSLPLWLPISEIGLMQRDGTRFRGMGGRVRGLEETLARVLEDELTRGRDRVRRAGLTAREEAAVLQSLR